MSDSVLLVVLVAVVIGVYLGGRLLGSWHAKRQHGDSGDGAEPGRPSEARPVDQAPEPSPVDQAPEPSPVDQAPESPPADDELRP